MKAFLRRRPDEGVGYSGRFAFWVVPMVRKLIIKSSILKNKIKYINILPLGRSVFIDFCRAL